MVWPSFFLKHISLEYDIQMLSKANVIFQEKRIFHVLVPPLLPFSPSLSRHVLFFPLEHMRDDGVGRGGGVGHMCTLIDNEVFWAMPERKETNENQDKPVQTQQIDFLHETGASITMLPSDFEFAWTNV
jgi:hypothetical protein